jgi:hypothetical protein
MKTKIFGLALVAFLLSIVAQAQEATPDPQKEKYRIVTGVRINPLFIYYKGQKTETTRLHLEVGTLVHKRWYFSAGYTPYANAIYNFNEYWFIGLDKKITVSMVIAGEYTISGQKLFLQFGPNIKISAIGNVFIFAFRSTDDPDWVIKFGTFIPLNILIKKK